MSILSGDGPCSLGDLAPENLGHRRRKRRRRAAPAFVHSVPFVAARRVVRVVPNVLGGRGCRGGRERQLKRVGREGRGVEWRCDLSR